MREECCKPFPTTKQHVDDFQNVKCNKADKIIWLGKKMGSVERFLVFFVIAQSELQLTSLRIRDPSFHNPLNLFPIRGN